MAEEEDILPTPFKDMKVGRCYLLHYVGGETVQFAGRLDKKSPLNTDASQYELIFERLERDRKRGPHAYKRFKHTHYTKTGRDEYYEVPCEHLNVEASERRKHALLAWGLRRPSIKERLERKFKKAEPVAAPTTPIRSSRSTRKSHKSPKYYMNLGASSSNSNSNSADRGRKTRRSSRSSSHRSIGSIASVKSRST